MKRNKALSNGRPGCWSWRANKFDDSDDEEEEEDEENGDVSSMSSDLSNAESSMSSTSCIKILAVETSDRDTNHCNATIDTSINLNQPPTPWGKSSAKMRIIDELKDPTSDIHLYLGQYTEKDFTNVNYCKILEEFAGNKYKLNLFRDNMKRILILLRPI